MIEKFCFDSAQDGLSLLVLGAVHGNEIAGEIAIKKLIEDFQNKKINLLRGRVVVVPVCNPQANKKDVRQIDENLNRVMKIHENPKTYEQKLANEICPLIKECDVLLDLHSTHCMEDVPFAFCDYPKEYNLKLIDALEVDYVLEGWPEIYANQSEIEDFSTEKTANEYGKSATTLECGYHKGSKAGEIAYNAILNTLRCFDMIEGGRPEKHLKTHIVMKNFVIKEKEGVLVKNYKHLDKVNKGDVIALCDDGETLVAPDNGYILLPNHEAKIGAEWFYFGVNKL